MISKSMYEIDVIRMKEQELFDDLARLTIKYAKKFNDSTLQCLTNESIKTQRVIDVLNELEDKLKSEEELIL